MNAPQAFQERLEREFRGRLRIRFSRKEQEWQIEQKVGRATLPDTYISLYNDDAIRAADGYLHVMSVRQGDRMPCPTCRYELKVPVFATVDVACPYCESRGRTTRIVAGYYPLEGDALIQHLRRLDPERGASVELARDADRRNDARLASMERDALEASYGVSQDFNRLFGIQQTGYTKASGASSYWER